MRWRRGGDIYGRAPRDLLPGPCAFAPPVCGAPQQRAAAAGAPATKNLSLTTGYRVSLGNLDAGVRAEDLEVGSERWCAAAVTQRADAIACVKQHGWRPPAAQELFGKMAPLKKVSITSPGTAELVFIRHADAASIVKKYDGVKLDGTRRGA